MFLCLSDVFVSGFASAETAVGQELVVLAEPVLHTRAVAGGQFKRGQEQILGLDEVVLVEQTEHLALKLSCGEDNPGSLGRGRRGLDVGQLGRFGQKRSEQQEQDEKEAQQKTNWFTGTHGFSITAKID
ncbi:hypothetical protein ES705_48401 [subsurface metagenome]